LRLDPKLVLALVGLSTASVQLDHAAAAQRALTTAAAVAGVSPHERVHVEVRARQFAAETAPQDAAKRTAYLRALDDAVQRFPSDVELWLARGMAEAPHPGDRGQSSPPGAIAFYQKALDLAPDHFAAHHYLAHAFENAGRTAAALEQGAAYARLAPQVPHARHMHGHALRRTGRVAEAIAEFEAADRLHVAYSATERVAAGLDWHYAHNLDLLGTSFMYVGQMRKAEQALNKSFALPTSTLIQTFNKRQWPLFLRARGRHDEARAAAAMLMANANPLIQAVGRIESGHHHLARKDFKQAAADANAAIAALRRAPVGAGLATVALEALQGEFYLRAGPRDKGRRMLEAAVVKASAQQGPDEWAQALLTLELAAAAARDAGDWQLADQVAQKMLEHFPTYAGAYNALGLVAAQKGDRALARTAFTRAEKYWSQADPDLRELATLRGWLKANPAR
jgi:Flp pilus assembly protein TadD